MRPRNRELVIPRESDRDLNSEVLSAKLATELSAPASDRNIELCSVTLEDSLIESVRDLPRPLIWEVAAPRELERDRNIEF